MGRLTAVKEVAADPFNCLGRYSDGAAESCGELRFMVKDGAELASAPTRRRRCAAPQCGQPYMHAGQIATLEAVVDHYARAPAAVSGTSELHPLTLSERERSARGVYQNAVRIGLETV